MNRVRLVTTAATASGSVSSGAMSVGFRISSGGSAVINGNIPLSDSLSAFNLNQIGQGVFYPAIAYTVSSGTLYIAEVRE